MRKNLPTPFSNAGLPSTTRIRKMTPKVAPGVGDGTRRLGGGRETRPPIFLFPTPEIGPPKDQIWRIPCARHRKTSSPGSSAHRFSA